MSGQALKDGQEAVMTAIAYNTIQPPFTLKFWDMSKKELRDYYNWFQKAIPERIDELDSAVRSSDGFEDWRSGYTPSSLNPLGNWFATQVQYRPRTEEEMQEIAIQSPFPRSNQVMTNRTEPLPFSVTSEVIGSGRCKSFLSLLTRVSRTPEAPSRDSGVRAPAMY